MARWILALLVVLSLSTRTTPIFYSSRPEDFFQVLLNKVNLKIGVLKFMKEFFEFRDRELPDVTPVNRQTYDFVVVGAGTAGSVIAARLSEVPQASVLLVEAGGHENLIMDIPLLALFLQLNKDTNWDYKTEPSEEYCLGIEDHQCKVARGKVMGGTGVLNFMIATRGNKHDYDEWAELTGDKSWGYEGMLQYFKKLEQFDVNQAPVDPEYHNFNGPVRITNPPYQTPLASAFIRAGEEMGYPHVEYNGRNQSGFAYMQTNQVNGERLSSNRAYLHPAKGRRNLSVSMFSQVTKILIDPKSKTAYGVEFVKFGRRIRVYARKEVIISAGGIASPQLLMLSGIGPAEHLRSHNISVLQDLPVGENMKDHISYGGLYFTVNQSVAIVVRDYLNPVNTTISDYLTKRSGQLATAGGCEGLGYVNVDDPTSDKPNIELLFGSVSLVASQFIRLPFGLQDRHYHQFFSNKLYRHAWIIFPLLMKPKSTGKVLLRSRDPFSKPKILANYLSHPDDVRVSIKGIRMAIELSKTNSMQRFGSQLHNHTVPGCELHVPDSDEYWECALRTYTVTLWHNSGTCKMGRENDPTAVVNTKLQVKGINRLRVADTSIMPNIVTAHTNIPTIAIAEKFSDIVKADYGYI